MKKMIIMLALGALAFAAQANIVDSSFSAITTNQIASSKLSGNPISIVLNKGWYTNTATTLATVSGGMLTRGTGGPGQLSGAVQYFTDAQTGVLKLQFDLQVTDDNSSDSIYLQLYGYKYSTTFTTAAIMTANDAAALAVNSSTQAGSAAWTVTPLVTYKYSDGTLNSGAWTTELQNFLDTDVTAGEYDMYGIRIIANSGAGDVINVDNVSVVPEPATVLLFGIGGFGAWALRRSSRKAREQSEE